MVGSSDGNSNHGEQECVHRDRRMTETETQGFCPAADPRTPVLINQGCRMTDESGTQKFLRFIRHPASFHR
jgi:hypothetical protein